MVPTHATGCGTDGGDGTSRTGGVAAGDVQHVVVPFGPQVGGQVAEGDGAAVGFVVGQEAAGASSGTGSARCAPPMPAPPRLSQGSEANRGANIVSSAMGSDGGLTQPTGKVSGLCLRDPEAKDVGRLAILNEV